MKTTIEIADSLLAEARKTAAQEKTTLRSLIEEGLREALRRRRTGGEPYDWPDLSFQGEGLTKEMEARGGWAGIRKAAYPDVFGADLAEAGHADRDVESER